MSKALNNLKCRAWILIKTIKEDKYKMIYSGGVDNDNFDDFPFNSPYIKDIMRTTNWTDTNDRELYEKDIITYKGKICVIFFNKSVGNYQVLYNDGKQETFSIEKAKFSKVVGNIYENPLILIK